MKLLSWSNCAASICLATGLMSCGIAHSQESLWAPDSDPTAKSLINLERLWLESSCKPNGIDEKVMADDFVGTSPEDGSLYTKQDALKSASSAHDENCQLHEVKVHFIGDTVAILYGRESAVHAAADGKKHTENRVWTDTWLKRNGSWQVVSAQDTNLK